MIMSLQVVNITRFVKHKQLCTLEKIYSHCLVYRHNRKEIFGFTLPFRANIVAHRNTQYLQLEDEKWIASDQMRSSAST
jgi:hypothetical protein